MPEEGLEPPRISASDPKSDVAAIYTIRAFAVEVGVEPTHPFGRLISSQLQYHYAIPPFVSHFSDSNRGPFAYKANALSLS